jgi:hypothetical protein
MNVAKLYEIVKKNVPCEVESPWGARWSWNGLGFPGRDLSTSVREMLFSDQWHLVPPEPTVADVLRERGYRDDASDGWEFSNISKRDIRLICPRITTIAEARRVCDFLDSLGEGN